MTHIDHVPDAATEQLWREHSHDLVRLATILVGPGEAHDVAVDAFLRAAPSADRPAVHNPWAFLMRAVESRTRSAPDERSTLASRSRSGGASIGRGT